MAAWFIWVANLAPVYADMRFQEGQGLSNRAGLDLSQLVVTLDDYITTVRSSPGEDFYYLSLGRALMTTSDALRARGLELGAPDPDASVADLLALGGQEAVAGFVQRSTPLSLMSYAEAVLLEAHELNPLNKDHFANLGRLNNYWYGITQDPERLRLSLSWYEQVAPIAPNDVTLINERAGVVTALGDYLRSAGDDAQAQARYAEAAELLQHSAELDQRYGDTFMRLGELARIQGDPDQATEHYVRAIELAPVPSTSSIQAIADSLAGRPDLVARLRDAFAAAAERSEARLASLEAAPEPAANLATIRQQTALLQSVTGLLAVRAGTVADSLEPYRRAAELQPANVEYSRNYTIVLSDTERYDAAIAEASRTLAALQTAGQSEQAAQIQQLIDAVRAAQN